MEVASPPQACHGRRRTQLDARLCWRLDHHWYRICAAKVYVHCSDRPDNTPTEQELYNVRVHTTNFPSRSRPISSAKSTRGGGSLLTRSAARSSSNSTRRYVCETNADCRAAGHGQAQLVQVDAIAMGECICAGACRMDERLVCVVHATESRRSVPHRSVAHLDHASPVLSPPIASTARSMLFAHNKRNTTPVNYGQIYFGFTKTSSLWGIKLEVQTG